MNLLLIEEDNEILLAFELARQLLRCHHADSPFFRLDLLSAFHERFSHNYRSIRWRGLRARCLPSQECGNVRERYVYRNQILKF